MNDGLVIRELDGTKKDLSAFIRLPYRIHRNHKQWLPPIYEDEWKVFDHKKNAAFGHCDTILFLAEKDGKAVGRIMGIINHSYNQKQNELAARFCFMECYEDQEVFNALLEAIEQWAVQKGMHEVVGPIGFSDKDPQGFLIEGFDDPVTVLITNHSFPYMIRFMEARAYGKKLDLVQYRFDLPYPLPEIYHKIAERVLRKGYKSVEFKRIKDIRPWVSPVFDLINASYQKIYGFSALTEEEAHEFSNRFLPILNPKFVKLVLDADNKLVAFLIGMPDMSKGLKMAGGRLFPLGFIPVLWSMKTTRQLNLMLAGIEESKRNLGLDSLMAVKIIESASQAKFKFLDSHLVMETNLKTRAEFERLGALMYKKYRIFNKTI
jgi:hypothetical protein